MALVLSSEYITPAELTGYVRTALADLPQNSFGLSAYLPDVQVNDIDFRASVGGGGLAKSAKYRSWDAESPISGRKALTASAARSRPSRSSADLASLTASRCAASALASLTRS